MMDKDEDFKRPAQVMLTLAIIGGIIVVVLAGLVLSTPPRQPWTGVENLRLSVDDAVSGPDYLEAGDPDAFESGEPVLRVEQTGGDPIDWNELIIYYDLEDIEGHHDMAVFSIAGEPFDPVSHSESRTGEVILLESTEDGILHSGDYISIMVVEGDSKVYQSTTVRIT